MKVIRRSILGTCLALLAFGAAGRSSSFAAEASDGFYEEVNLVSDGALPAPHIDPNLVNAWGIAFPNAGDVMVANNGTGTATSYDGNGVPLLDERSGRQQVIAIPGAPGTGMPGTPTGVVYNPTSDFPILPFFGIVARFLFATEDGLIIAWAPELGPDQAVIQVDNSLTGAVYKGIAIANNGTGNFLYATDFFNGKVDVFDSQLRPVTVPGHFLDTALPAGYAPFGIRNINGSLYVTFALRTPGETDEQHGPGLGIVDVFDANGFLLRRLITDGALNAPWGLALAPADFGRFSSDLLVGNFGDGTIHAYDIQTGQLRGTLSDASGQPIVIDGLWGLSFGNGTNGQATNVLFFAAGPNDEADGLYGRIEARQSAHVPAPCPQ